MNLKKLEMVISLVFSIMVFILFGMFLFEGSIRLNGFFFVLLYILSGANIFLITYNQNGATSKVIAYLVASILLLILIFALIFVL
ncbi:MULTISPECIES: hypothetical protein [Enterobacterales]|uniref:Uncharacterized protein n=4 Tax=Morganellaceae TaxID=1903414 RepID=A0A7L4ZD78_PROMI|nr:MULTISPECIES: hypothetical protein [Enterobacterales]EIL1985308.1 hypothetical protein [Providencia rettgeri]EJD6083811.1 hypothetical protein [Providencia rettgeri]EJD6501314.1 hypothetical protein [Providencia rettgeri]EJD6509668.1 hypothetical protein [Providencia rettgeri]EJD6510189.1 hypothetical protein [Providencia rettgeri]